MHHLPAAAAALLALASRGGGIGPMIEGGPMLLTFREVSRDLNMVTKLYF
jgi:hypothetical protein